MVIVTTGLKDSRDYHEKKEVRTIVDIGAVPYLGQNITVISFMAPLNYTHYAGTEYQAEVGWLSRRLIV
jgi:hypothetical protein